MNKLDAKGFNCPEPVIMTKKALSSLGTPLEVTVDNKVPMENIKRFATGRKYNVIVREEDTNFVIEISK